MARFNITGFILALSVAGLFVQCNNGKNKSDAYGNFEVEEVSVSAEVSGIIQKLNVEEGAVLDSGSIVGQIDSSQLLLKRAQITAQLAATDARLPLVDAQANVYREQIRIQEKELVRQKRLFDQKAATQKQIDDLEGALLVLHRQLESTLAQKTSIASEREVIKTQFHQVEDQIMRCKIRNPIKGTVLLKISRKGEMVNAGKPIYRIANLEFLNLKAYVSGSQLSEFKLGDSVLVLTDGANGEVYEYEGAIFWISANAEFTPRTIQTREERINLVYPVKVRVKNNGQLRIGMPGEVILRNKQ
jgi:HlyD family secretion protein